MRTGDYYNGKTFVSDGTAVGTSITTAPRYADYPYKSSSDGNEVYWSSYNYNNDITPRFWSLVSGSTEPVQLLNSYVNTTTSYTMASGYTLIEGYYNPAKQLIATDGTAAHTYTLDGIDFILQVNTTNNTIWHTMNTTPYGTELYKTVLTDSGFTTSMVKDIYAGSSSAFGNYQSNSGVFLPNGKIVFSANDGIHGGSPWVTDGTETGTLLLQDTNNGNSAILDASQFTEVNGKAVYKVYHDGWELGVTDGTTAGTNVLEIYSGYGDSNPTIIGTINDKLYFTATDATGLGLFSTDGNTFSKLVSVSDSNAQILGYTANKAYFALTTTAIGKELWSVDLTAVTPTIALVKDILTGSGSGLTGTLNNQMIGDKILFNAYTSGTNQGLFISDGSSSGTVQLASSFTDKAIIGNKVFFANSSGVSVSDVSATTVSATQVVAGDFTTQVNYSLPDRLQSDADQAFYLTADNKLKVATTATDSIQLADHVSKFKVVADNAIYFIETNSSNVASLWYTDGTASGTRYIEDLSSSASSYDMENAVAIHTVGVAG